MPITISGSTGISGVDGSASTPAVQGADTNTGMFFPAADTIAFVEGGTEVMRINSSGNVGIGTSSPGSLLTVNGNLAFNSGYGSAAVAYGCRAWVNFDGTTNVGGFCTIRASGNVTSVADNGTGIYTINFTNAMPDVNYAFAGSSKIPGNATGTLQLQNDTGTQLVGSLAIETLNSANTTRTDASVVEVVVFR